MYITCSLCLTRNYMCATRERINSFETQNKHKEILKRKPNWRVLNFQSVKWRHRNVELTADFPRDFITFTNPPVLKPFIEKSFISFYSIKNIFLFSTLPIFVFILKGEYMILYILLFYVWLMVWWIDRSFRAKLL